MKKSSIKKTHHFTDLFVGSEPSDYTECLENLFEAWIGSEQVENSSSDERLFIYGRYMQLKYFFEKIQNEKCFL